MPTGLLNVVCDECYGGRLVFLPTGERQLEHQAGCPYKYREDTFLIQIGLATNCKYFHYPKEAQLNPIIYDLLWHGSYTERGNATFAKRGESKAQKRAHRVNDNFQLVREALIKDGRWKNIMKEVIELKVSYH